MTEVPTDDEQARTPAAEPLFSVIVPAYGRPRFLAEAVASILGGGFPTVHAYVGAFALCAVALFAGVLVGLAIPQRRLEAAFAPHTVGDLEAEQV